MPDSQPALMHRLNPPRPSWLAPVLVLAATVLTGCPESTPSGFLDAGETSWRVDEATTLLSDGSALITGGMAGRETVDVEVSWYYSLSSAEIFRPESRAFEPAQPMVSPRHAHAATLLSNGTVLITGGAIGNWLGGDPPPALGSAEIFDPTTGSFEGTGALLWSRTGHTATLLANGTVLVAGGGSSVRGPALSSAELYDPVTGSFSSTGTMSEARIRHTATLLSNGTVLVVGGSALGSAEILGSAELYDPITGSFSPTGSMLVPSAGHTAILLSSGDVLVASVKGLEIYDVASGAFRQAGTETCFETATLLGDGLVLGTCSSGTVLFDPATGLSRAGPSLLKNWDTYVQRRASLVGNGAVLVTTAAADYRQLSPHTSLGTYREDVELYSP